MWRILLTMVFALLLTACASVERESADATYEHYDRLCCKHARQVAAEALNEDRYRECMAYQTRHEVSFVDYRH